MNIKTLLVALEKFLEMAFEENVLEVISIFECKKDIDIEKLVLAKF